MFLQKNTNNHCVTSLGIDRVQNYYDILKLAPDSGDADISDRVGERRTQLLRLIKIPKRREDAQQELQQLEVIARTLLDPRERAAYDARLVEPASPAEPIATAPIDIPAPPPVKFCLACGNAIREGDLFCNQCGDIIHAPSDVAAGAISERTELGKVPGELSGSAAEPQIPTPRDSRNQDTVRSVQPPLPLPALPIGATQSRGRLIAQVVVLLLVAAAVVYFWPHSSSQVDEQTTSSTLGHPRDLRDNESRTNTVQDAEMSKKANADGLRLLKASNPDFQAAKRKFEEAVRSDSSNVEALNNLGYVYQRLGDFRTSEAYILKVIQLAPDRRVAYGNLGYVQAKLGKSSEASYNFCEYIKRFNDFERGKATLKRVMSDPDVNVQSAVNGALAQCSAPT